MIDCPCGFGKNLKEDQKECPICGTDLTLLHLLRKLPSIYYEEGIRLLEQGELDKAIKMLMTSITLNYNSSAPYIALGDIFMQKGLYEEAINQYNKALEINPENEEIRRKKEKAEKEQNLLKERQIKCTQRLALQKKIIIGSVMTILLMIFTITFLWQNLVEKRQEYFHLLKRHENILDLIKKQENMLVKKKQELKKYKDLVKKQENMLAEKKQEYFHLLKKYENILDLIKKQENMLVKKKMAEFLYTVKDGDSLSLIAYRFYGKQNMWWKIYEANKDKIKDPAKIYRGQILSIPILRQENDSRSFSKEN